MTTVIGNDLQYDLWCPSDSWEEFSFASRADIQNQLWQQHEYTIKSNIVVLISWSIDMVMVYSKWSGEETSEIPWNFAEEFSEGSVR